MSESGVKTYDQEKQTQLKNKSNIEKVTNLESVSRKQLKRNRNRELAQRSRNKRREKVMSLVLETEKLEDKQKDLQAEINILHQEASQLEYLLTCHRWQYGTNCPIFENELYYA
ncbi:uncharacterized protein [Antedon mediterranea]|uniref:uncharacterized protein n=1 Tax=Antedon mediterranea TaxID=105859 RepID=UPI003AF845C2